ncbi:MAG: dihydroorotase [Ignavibacteria bacterium]|nr:dihydroorotase [Ignavibacteria bacterium]
MKLVFKNIFINSPLDKIKRKTDLTIVNGVIKKIGKADFDKNAVEFDFNGITCVPGFFDMHVHFREPGQTHKEDMITGMQSAMNGGFTGVMIMPNTNPPIDNGSTIKELLCYNKNSLVDINISACVTKNREGKELSNLSSLKKAGAISFTDDGSPVYNPHLMRTALEEAGKIDCMIVQHAEDMDLSNHGVINEGVVSKKLKAKGIPQISETAIVERDILITEYVKKAHYHVQHISCGRSIDMLRDAKRKKINVTGEACPHHFILDETALLKYGTNAKMNPPLRTKKDVSEVVKGIKDGTIDVVCTDHAPHTGEEKSRGLDKAPFGIIGLETAIGLTYTFLVKKKIITFEKMIELMSINPRKILNLKQPGIRIGEKANLTFLDTKAKWKVNVNKFKSKSRNTPFGEYNLQCKPYAVLNNSKLYFTDL